MWPTWRGRVVGGRLLTLIWQCQWIVESLLLDYALRLVNAVGLANCRVDRTAPLWQLHWLKEGKTRGPGFQHGHGGLLPAEGHGGQQKSEDCAVATRSPDPVSLTRCRALCPASSTVRLAVRPGSEQEGGKLRRACPCMLEGL